MDELDIYMASVAIWVDHVAPFGKLDMHLSIMSSIDLSVPGNQK